MTRSSAAISCGERSIVPQPRLKKVSSRDWSTSSEASSSSPMTPSSPAQAVTDAARAAARNERERSEEQKRDGCRMSAYLQGSVANMVTTSGKVRYIYFSIKLQELEADHLVRAERDDHRPPVAVERLAPVVLEQVRAGGSLERERRRDPRGAARAVRLVEAKHQRPRVLRALHGVEHQRRVVDREEGASA